MPRPKSDGMSIAKLQAMLKQQQSRRSDLLKERRKLEMQIDKIDRQLSSISGGNGGGATVTPTGRVRNEKSLVTYLEEVLAGQSKGMGVAEIVEAVQKAGYQTGSANFRGIVNQTLIKERKKFVNVSRGVYALKK